MKKTVRTIATYIFAAVLAVFCLFTVSAQSFLSARAAAYAAELTGFDSTNVLDDLEGSTIAGKEFSLADYAPNTYTKTDVILLAEYCYGYYENMRSDYGLYVYVWNPQLTGYDLRSELNQIELATAENDHYNKYRLEFLNMSEEPGYEGVLYKFKVSLSADQKDEIFEDFSGQSERYYHVAGIELLQNGELNATDYNVNKAFVYSGYAAGYGPDAEAESTLVFSQETGKTLELDVHSTAYRPEGNNGVNRFTQDSLHSVYFAVPNETIEEYGELTAVHATWRNAVLTPTIVIAQSVLNEYDGLEEQLYDNLGVNIGKSGDFKYAFYADALNDDTANYGFGYQFTYNRVEDPNDLYIRWLFGNYVGLIWAYSDPITGYSANPKHVANMCESDVLDTLYMYLPANTNDVSDYVMPSGTTKAQMLELSETVYKDSNKINGKYAEELFASVDEDFTDIEIQNDEEFSLTSTTLKDGWDAFWSGLTGGGDRLWNTEYENLPAIYPVKESDMTGDTEAICENLKIGIGDFEEFKEYYDSHKDDYTVYLFRYQQSDYEAIDCTILDNTSGNNWYELDEDPYCYIFQETVNLDFDIIDVSFTDDQLKTTVIAVISDPIDVIPEPTPPIGMEDEVPWLTIVLLLAVSIGGIVVTRIVKHYAKKTK